METTGFRAAIRPASKYLTMVAEQHASIKAVKVSVAATTNEAKRVRKQLHVRSFPPSFPLPPWQALTCSILYLLPQSTLLEAVKAGAHVLDPSTANALQPFIETASSLAGQSTSTRPRMKSRRVKQSEFFDRKIQPATSIGEVSKRAKISDSDEMSTAAERQQVLGKLKASLSLLLTGGNN